MWLSANVFWSKLARGRLCSVCHSFMSTCIGSYLHPRRHNGNTGAFSVFCLLEPTICALIMPPTRRNGGVFVQMATLIVRRALSDLNTEGFCLGSVGAWFVAKPVNKRKYSCKRCHENLGNLLAMEPPTGHVVGLVKCTFTLAHPEFNFCFTVAQCYFTMFIYYIK